MLVCAENNWCGTVMWPTPSSKQRFLRATLLLEEGESWPSCRQSHQLGSLMWWFVVSQPNLCCGHCGIDLWCLNGGVVMRYALDTVYMSCISNNEQPLNLRWCLQGGARQEFMLILKAIWMVAPISASSCALPYLVDVQIPWVILKTQFIYNLSFVYIKSHPEREFLDWYGSSVVCAMYFTVNTWCEQKKVI